MPDESQAGHRRRLRPESRGERKQELDGPFVGADLSRTGVAFYLVLMQSAEMLKLWKPQMSHGQDCSWPCFVCLAWHCLATLLCFGSAKIWPCLALFPRGSPTTGFRHGVLGLARRHSPRNRWSVPRGTASTSYRTAVSCGTGCPKCGEPGLSMSYKASRSALAHPPVLRSPAARSVLAGSSASSSHGSRWPSNYGGRGSSPCRRSFMSGAGAVGAVGAARLTRTS